MSLVPDPSASTSLPPGGLCLSCAHVRVIRSGRGSVFLMCERGLRREPGFIKYPRLPVVACPGHESSGGRGPVQRDSTAGGADAAGTQNH
jgi:hypothetical protein